jgi:chromosome segregation ATPase
MSEGHRMSRLKTEKLNLRCKEHQVLNKYYLIRERKFVCEYDGFDKDGPDSFLHLPQILEQNRRKILDLQTSQVKNTSQELMNRIPLINAELNTLDLDANTINSTMDNFSENFIDQLKDLIFQNEAYAEIREIINQINFNADGKPDLRKIGMDVTKELNLITLAQLLVLNQDKEVEKIKLYKDLTAFLENYQDELLELVNQSSKTIDLINDGFSDEIAIMDGVRSNPNSKINKFRMLFVTRAEHESLLRERDSELAHKRELMLQQEKINNELRIENLRLNDIIKEHLKDKEKIKSLDFTLESLQRQFESQRLKFSDEKDSLTNYYEKLLRDASAEHSKLVQSYEEQLDELRKELSEERLGTKKYLEALKVRNDQEKAEIRENYEPKIRELEMLLNQQRKDREADKRIFEKEIELLLRQLTDSNSKANDYYKKRISELELLLIESEKENKHLREVYESEILELKRKQESYLNQIREENKLHLNDLENNLINEKTNSKKISFEREALNIKHNDALNKIHLFEEDIKYLTLSNEKKLQYMEAQFKELALLKEKTEQNLEEERLRWNTLNAENLALREKRNELNMRIVELEELLKVRQLEEEKKIANLNNMLLDLKRAKDSADNKYLTLEVALNEDRAKYNSTIYLFEKKTQDLNEQLTELRRVNEAYMDRISELEKEVYDLRNQINRLETEKQNLSQTIIDLNSQLNLNLTSSKNSKNDDQRKLTELSGQASNFLKIKELLNNRIKDFEEQLDNEKSDFLEYQKDNENRLHLLQMQLSEANNNNSTLSHELELVRADYDTEKSRQQKKINDQTLLLQEMTKLKDKNHNDFSEEKMKLHQNIIELERRIKELTFHLEDNSNKNDFNYKRVRELELILSEERKKTENYILESEKRNSDLSNKVAQLQLINQEVQKQNYTLEHDLADEKSKLSALQFEKENLSKNYKEKELNLNRIIEDLRRSKLEDDKAISELSCKVKDFGRIREKMEHRVIELEEMLRNERDRNINGCQSHERLIKDLQVKFEEALRSKDAHEKDSSDLKAKYKVVCIERDSLSERRKMLEEANEELSAENDDLRRIRESYLSLKGEYERNLSINENLHLRVKQLEEDLARERSKYNQTVANMNNKLQELSSENNALLQNKDKLEKENSNLKNKLKNLQLEYELLQSKLDEQYLELNSFREAVKENAKESASLKKNLQIVSLENEDLRNKLALLEDRNRYLEANIKELEERIHVLDSELKEKNILLNREAEENKTLRSKISDKEKKIENLNKIIIDLEEELAKKPIVVKAEKPREKDFRSIDLTTDEYNELLLNKRNWPILEPWLAPLRINSNGNLKLNLLYKATRDGFDHTSFKEKCIGKANTLVVVWTEFNKLIGGFTPLAWKVPVSESHQYASDESKNTFMFSLSAGKKYRLLKPNYAICNSKVLGPIFGGGSDLEIVSECNIKTNNYCSIGHTFEYTDKIENFYGGKKFTVKDYEVYEVLL